MRLGHRASGSRPDAQLPRRPSADAASSNSPHDGGQLPISIMQSNIPPGPGYGNGLAAARSPPKAKSTSHVPCKFYPMGQCQAGSACQFSHDLDAATQNAPCKYFSRGSCKFGPSCALAHVLPNGQVINRNPRGGPGGFNRRANHQSNLFAAAPSTPLSILTQEQQGVPPEFAGYPVQEQVPAYTHQPNSPMYRTEIHVSNSSSPYGSPHELLQAKSPPRPGLSARDAQLPSSWDSQGISQAARNGPFAASVPNRFGVDSPPSSYPHQLGSTSRRDQAFADTANLDGVLQGLGSSPREIEQLSFTKRPLHSERFARPRPPVSSSLNFSHTLFRTDGNSSEPDSESDDGAGEDLLPSSLHDEIGMGMPKVRRASKSNGPIGGEEDNSYWSATQRRILSTSSGVDIKTSGSLSPHSASPSRYSAMWAARSSLPKSDAESNPVSAFGHVGSPLRPSNLRTSSTSEGLSMLTSQLQRARLGENAPPTPAKKAPEPALPLRRPAPPRDAEPAASLSSSIKAEDEGEGMFSMEDEPEAPAAPRTWAAMAAGSSTVGVIGAGRKEAS